MHISISVRFISVLDTAGQEGFSAMREQVLVFDHINLFFLHLIIVLMLTNFIVIPVHAQRRRLPFGVFSYGH